MRSPRSHLAVHVSVLSLVAGLIAWLAVAGSSAAGAAGPTSPDVPYSPDAQSQGALRLYDAAGVAITGGSLTDAPFATYAVADGSGTHAGDTRATLYLYTPVQGQTPAQWTGNNQMSGSTAYPVAGIPAAIAGPNATSKITAEDFTLELATQDIPNVSTSFAGLYELRMLTSFPAQATANQYYSADIKVTGSTWTLVNPVPPPVTTPPATATTTTLTATPPSGALTSASVTLSATVSPAAAGSVQFKDGAANIGSAQTIAAGAAASVSTTFATAGSKSLTAVFTPANGALFAASTGSLTYAVSAAPSATTTTLAASPQTGGPSNSPVTLTATVAPSGAAGSVQFLDGATPLGSATVSAGAATLTGTLFTQGSHSVTAVFTPTNSALFTGSTSAAVIVTTIAPATATTTTLAVNPASGATTTSSVTLTATVTPSNAVGSVQFKDGAAAIGSPVALAGGTAALPTVLAASGPHSLTAVFTPAAIADFTTSTSSTVSYEVAATSTTTALSANPMGGVANTPISLQATVTPSAATGSVQFRDGATALGAPVAVSGGSAVLSWSQFGTGPHSVTATFVPTGGVYATSTSQAVAFSMSAPPTSTTTALTAAPASGATTATSVTLTATVTAADALNGAVAGTVQFKDGAANLGSPVALSGTTAATTATFATAAAKSLTAVFTPADATKFAASTGSLTFSVSAQPTATVLTVSPDPLTTTSSVTLTASVTPAAAGTVQFRDGATNLGSPATVTAGSAALAGQSVLLGAHSFTAVFTPADATVFAASTSAAVAVSAGCGPTPTDSVIAVGANGATLALDPELAAGDLVCLTAGGFASGAAVEISLDGSVLQTIDADEAGLVPYLLTVPSGIGSGDHSVSFVGDAAEADAAAQVVVNGITTVTFDFSVALAPSPTPTPTTSAPTSSAPPSPAGSAAPIASAGAAPLARTGASVTGLAGWAALLVMAGAGVLIAGSLRRPSRHA